MQPAGAKLSGMLDTVLCYNVTNCPLNMCQVRAVCVAAHPSDNWEMDTENVTLKQDEPSGMAASATCFNLSDTVLVEGFHSAIATSQMLICTLHDTYNGTCSML